MTTIQEKAFVLICLLTPRFVASLDERFVASLAGACT